MFFANQHRSQIKTRNSTNVPLHHVVKSCCGIHFVTYWDFPAISAVIGWKFLAVSVVTCRISGHDISSMRKCKKSLSGDQKVGIFRPYL